MKKPIVTISIAVFLLGTAGLLLVVATPRSNIAQLPPTPTPTRTLTSTPGPTASQPTNSVPASAPPSAQNQALPSGWHLVDLAPLPIEVAIPSGWTVVNGVAVSYPVLPYADLSDQYRDSIRIEKNIPSPGEHTIEDILADTDLLQPSLTSISGVAAMQAYRAAPALTPNIDYSQKVWEVFLPQEQLYDISYECPLVAHRTECEQIVSRIHFK